MSIVNEIKNPLYNDEFLKSMILLYARQTSKERKSGSYIYSGLVVHPESEANADKSIYLWNFKKNVEQDVICKLLTEVLKYNKKDAIRIYMDLFLDEKDELESIYIDKEDLISKLEDAGLLQIYSDKKYMEMSVKDILREVFHADGTMGFHIYKSKFYGAMEGYSDSTLKFYLNIGENTYEFSKIFKQKCEERNLRYMYKVVDPEKDEETRADKMCIYMGLSDVEEYIEVVREIRQEHPEFNYKEACPLMGSIEGWIGIGADPYNFEMARSYNESRAILLENSLRAVFGNTDEKKILHKLEVNQALYIHKLRAELQRRAAEYGITKHFALDDAIVDALAKPPKERFEEYDKKKNQLVSNLPSNERKLTLLQRFKDLFRPHRSKKNHSPFVESMPGNQTKYGEAMDIQLTIPGTEDLDEENSYIVNLQINIDENNQMPITQTPIGSDTENQSNNQEKDHDDSDVWI